MGNDDITLNKVNAKCVAQNLLDRRSRTRPFREVHRAMLFESRGE